MHVQIPGLNAPIPPGAEFGYAPGQWGKPPVDEQGIPLYGDVFGEALGEESEDEQAGAPPPVCPLLCSPLCAILLQLITWSCVPETQQVTPLQSSVPLV